MTTTDYQVWPWRLKYRPQYCAQQTVWVLRIVLSNRKTNAMRHDKNNNYIHIYTKNKMQEMFRKQFSRFSWLYLMFISSLWFTGTAQVCMSQCPMHMLLGLPPEVYCTSVVNTPAWTDGHLVDYSDIFTSRKWSNE